MGALLGARARELSTRTWRDAVDELVERHHGALVVPGTVTHG